MSGRDEKSAEEKLIADYFRPLARHPGALSLSDDAAFVTPPAGCDLVLTTDGVISGVHCFPDDPPELIARKALRMNLSDLAAKGAAPLGFLVSLALPDKIGGDWLKGFAAGLDEDAQRYGIALLGGDTDRTPGPLSVSIAAFGSVPSGSMVRRSGAQPGHCLFVSGTIGDSALGLHVRRDGDTARRWNLGPADADRLTHRYLLPQPRHGLAETVRLHASAAMDVSDGLAGDLAKLCRASGVSADIEAARVPLSKAAAAVLAADPGAMETILAGGDDYEILCTVPEESAAAFRAGAGAAGIAVTQLGRIGAPPTEGQGQGQGQGAASFRDAQGAVIPLRRASFSHF